MPWDDKSAAVPKGVKILAHWLCNLPKKTAAILLVELPCGHPPPTFLVCVGSHSGSEPPAGAPFPSLLSSFPPRHHNSSRRASPLLPSLPSLSHRFHIALTSNHSRDTC